MPTKLTQIHCKIDARDKNLMDKLMHKFGINTSDAIRLFIKQTILDKGIPFRITLHRPSSLDRAIQEIKTDDSHKSRNLNDLKKWINK